MSRYCGFGRFCFEGWFFLFSFFHKTHSTKKIKKIITKRNNVVFISKTSDSNVQYGSVAGDIFYYNHATRTSGFSIPYVDDSNETLPTITTS